MNSAIFKGYVRHRRMTPVEHAFDYRLFMMYLDLSELDTLFQSSWLFSNEGCGLARFCRSDHMGDPEIPLHQAVRDLVEQRLGKRPLGPIRLLTHMRYFGYVFNPVSFYYCFEPSGEGLEVIVAEVNNTPWGEQHCYVLPTNQSSRTGSVFKFAPTKEMHVSPFMQMDVDYDWRFGQPSGAISIHMENHRMGEKVFDATLNLKRVELSRQSLLSTLIAFPFMTFKVIAAIHWQALKLWLKGNPVHDHPDKQANSIRLEEKNT